jgi:CRP-like cAMP-binding protein
MFAVADSGKAHNALLKSLSGATAAMIGPHLHEITFSTHEVLNEPGDEAEFAFFPHTGMISILAVLRDGNAIETATVGREGAIGLMSGLAPYVTSTRTVAQSPVVASRISAANFRRLVQTSDELRDLVVRYNEALLSQVQITAACNAVHTLEARLSRWILQTRDRIDDDSLPLTHELLAQMLGVRRSSVSEVASKLQGANLISYSRGKLTIDDRAGLERSACECYETIKENAESILNRAP